MLNSNVQVVGKLTMYSWLKHLIQKEPDMAISCLIDEISFAKNLNAYNTLSFALILSNVKDLNSSSRKKVEELICGFRNEQLFSTNLKVLVQCVKRNISKDNDSIDVVKEWFKIEIGKENDGLNDKMIKVISKCWEWALLNGRKEIEAVLKIFKRQRIDDYSKIKNMLEVIDKEFDKTILRLESKVIQNEVTKKEKERLQNETVEEENERLQKETVEEGNERLRNENKAVKEEKEELQKYIWELLSDNMSSIYDRIFRNSLRTVQLPYDPKTLNLSRHETTLKVILKEHQDLYWEIVNVMGTSSFNTSHLIELLIDSPTIYHRFKHYGPPVSPGVPSRRWQFFQVVNHERLVEVLKRKLIYLRKECNVVVASNCSKANIEKLLDEDSFFRENPNLDNDKSVDVIAIMKMFLEKRFKDITVKLKENAWLLKETIIVAILFYVKTNVFDEFLKMYGQFIPISIGSYFVSVDFGLGKPVKGNVVTWMNSMVQGGFVFDYFGENVLTFPETCKFQLLVEFFGLDNFEIIEEKISRLSAGEQLMKEFENLKILKSFYWMKYMKCISKKKLTDIERREGYEMFSVTGEWRNLYNWVGLSLQSKRYLQENNIYLYQVKKGVEIPLKVIKDKGKFRNTLCSSILKTTWFKGTENFNLLQNFSLTEFIQLNNVLQVSEKELPDYHSSTKKNSYF